jgi:hypothetical protein
MIGSQVYLHIRGPSLVSICKVVYNGFVEEERLMKVGRIISERPMGGNLVHQR